MKKLIISVAAIAFAGVLLSSCGGNKKITAPKKGKSVDKIECKFYNTNITISKNDDALTVLNHITDLEDILLNSSNDNKKFYKQYYTEDTNVKAKNIYDSYHSAMFENYSKKVKREEYIEKYYKCELNNDVEKHEIYDYNTVTETSKEVEDKYEHSYTNQYAYLDAGYGTYSGIDVVGDYCDYTTSTYDLNAGHYIKSNYKDIYKTNTETETVDYKYNQYTYLNKSVKYSDEAYDKEFETRQGDDWYDYTISEYLPISHDISYLLYIDTNTIYDETFASHYDLSFELTDKELIFKLKSDITEEVLRQAFLIRDLFGITYEEAVEKAVKEGLNGSYSEEEIWLDYSKDYGFTYTYHTKKEVNKLNIKYELTENNYNYLTNNSRYFTDFIGKDYTYTGTITKTSITKSEDVDYTNKIDKFLTKAKKNNLFEGLIFA